MSDAQVFPSSRESEEALLGAIIEGGEAVYERVSGWIRETDAFHFRDNVQVSMYLASPLF